MALGKKHKSVIDELRSELQVSAEYPKAVKAAAESHFAAVWDPNCMKPHVNEVESVLNCDDKRIILTAVIRVESAGASVTYTVTERTSLVLDSGKTVEELIEPNRQALLSLEQALIDKVHKSLPQSSENFFRKHMASNHPDLDSIATTIAEDPGMLSILDKRTKVFQSTYESLLEKEPCPQGFLPAQIASLKLYCSTEGYIGTCILRIHLDCGMYFERRKEYDLGYCPFYIDEGKKREYLLSQILESLKDLVMPTDGIAPVFVATSFQAVPGMTDQLESLLQQGSVSLGHVTLRRTKDRQESACILYRLQPDKDIVRIGSCGTSISKCRDGPICLDTREQPVPPLEYTALPTEIAGFFRLGEALEQTLNQMLLDKDVSIPNMVLQLAKDCSLQLHCGSKNLALGTGEMSTGQRIMRLATQSVAEEEAKAAFRNRQLAVLNGLNPTELAILRHISKNGETWCAELADEIDGQVCTMKSYTGECLENLAVEYMPVKGGYKPLLEVYWGFNDAYDECLMYCFDLDIDRKLLESATGRPFRASEVGKMKPAARGDWFTGYLLEADGEQRWARFNEALDYMPRTFLTTFAKSEAGQTFLKGFTGPEAMFVRLTVEELPGCKRLAAKLWPGEAEGKDGEE